VPIPGTPRAPKKVTKGLARLVGGPLHQEDEEQGRADIEQADAPHHAVDGVGQNPPCVLRLVGRDAEQFDARIGEDHALNDYDGRQQAVREDTAMFGDQMQAGREAAEVTAQDQDRDAGEQEQHQRRDLDQRKPELKLAEPFDGSPRLRTRQARSRSLRNLSALFESRRPWTSFSALAFCWKARRGGRNCRKTAFRLTAGPVGSNATTRASDRCLGRLHALDQRLQPVRVLDVEAERGAVDFAGEHRLQLVDDLFGGSRDHEGVDHLLG